MKKMFLAVAAVFAYATASVAQGAWMMKVKMKSGEVKEIACDDVDNVSFGKKSEPLYADVTATNTYNLYYGAVSDGTGMYMLHLCDGELTTGGLPTEINKHDIRLTVIASPSSDSDNASLESGRYTLSDNPNEKGIFGKQCVYIETNTVKDGKVDGFLDSLKVCTLDVENKGDGAYHLEVNGELKEHGTIRFVYDGKLEFVNKDKNYGYDYITSDVDFKPLGMSGRYVKATDSYCDYSLAFYNCEIDNSGFVVGSGGLLNLVLLTDYAVPMNIDNIVGTYDVVMPVSGAKYVAGKFIGGVMRDTSYGSFPMGSYYEDLDDEGYAKAYGMFNGGTVTVSRQLGELTFDCDWVTPQGFKVKMNYTGDVSSITDTSESDDAYSVSAQNEDGGSRIMNADLKVNVKAFNPNASGTQIFLKKR